MSGRIPRLGIETYSSASGASDNQILTSAVDASGNPAFLTAGTGLTLNILGGTTPLVLFNHGKWQTLSSNVTLTLTGTSNQFIYAVQDTTNAALVAADFGASALPPDYDYVAPGSPATDQHWFDLSTNQMKRYSGSAWVAVNRIFLGVARTSAAAIDGVVCEPYRLSPQKRFELFGDASDGILTVTGATTVDGYKNYSFVRVDGAAGVLKHTAYSTTVHTFGLRLRSQNPILIINSGTVDVTGLGIFGAAGTTGAGGAGSSGGFYTGGGGGGGGAGVTNAGGAGGKVSTVTLPLTIVGTGGGGPVKTAGTAGLAAQSAAKLFWPFSSHLMGFGASSGAGGGDGTRKGGTAARGGGYFAGFAPAWLIAATSSITADGSPGVKGEDAGADDLGGGGSGGGGGGVNIVAGGYVNNLGTISAAGGTGGAGGTNHGAAGGAGGVGTALAVRLY